MTLSYDLNATAGGVVLHSKLDAGRYGSNEATTAPGGMSRLTITCSYDTSPGSGAFQEPCKLQVRGLPDLPFRLNVVCGKPSMTVNQKPIMFVIEAPKDASQNALKRFRELYCDAKGAFAGVERRVEITNRGSMPLEVEDLAVKQQQHQQPLQLSCSSTTQPGSLPFVIQPSTGYLSSFHTNTKGLQLTCRPTELVYGQQLAFDAIFSTNIAASPLQDFPCMFECNGPEIMLSRPAIYFKQLPASSSSPEVGSSNSSSEVRGSSSSGDGSGGPGGLGGNSSSKVPGVSRSRREVVLLKNSGNRDAYVVIERDQWDAEFLLAVSHDGKVLMAATGQQLQTAPLKIPPKGSIELVVTVWPRATPGRYQGTIEVTCVNSIRSSMLPAMMQLNVLVEVTSAAVAAPMGSPMTASVACQLGTGDSSSSSSSRHSWSVGSFGQVPMTVVRSMAQAAAAASLLSPPPHLAASAAARMDIVMAAVIAAELPTGGPVAATALEQYQLLQQLQEEPAAAVGSQQEQQNDTILAAALLLTAGIPTADVRMALVKPGGVMSPQASAALDSLQQQLRQQQQLGGRLNPALLALCKAVGQFKEAPAAEVSEALLHLCSSADLLQPPDVNAAATALEACLDSGTARKLQQALFPLAISLDGASKLQVRLQSLLTISGHSRQQQQLSMEQTSSSPSFVASRISSVLASAGVLQWLYKRDGGDAAGAVTLEELMVLCKQQQLLDQGSAVQELLEAVTSPNSMRKSKLLELLLPKPANKLVQQLKGLVLAPRSTGSSSNIMSAVYAIMNSAAAREFDQEQVDWSPLQALQLLLQSQEEDQQLLLREGSLAALYAATREPNLLWSIGSLFKAKDAADPAETLKSAVGVVQALLHTPCLQPHLTQHVKSQLLDLPTDKLVHSAEFAQWPQLRAEEQRAYLQQLLAPYEQLGLQHAQLGKSLWTFISAVHSRKSSCIDVCKHGGDALAAWVGIGTESGEQLSKILLEVIQLVEAPDSSSAVQQWEQSLKLGCKLQMSSLEGGLAEILEAGTGLLQRPSVGAGLTLAAAAAAAAAEGTASNGRAAALDLVSWIQRVGKAIAAAETVDQQPPREQLLDTLALTLLGSGQAAAFQCTLDDLQHLASDIEGTREAASSAAAPLFLKLLAAAGPFLTVESRGSLEALHELLLLAEILAGDSALWQLQGLDTRIDALCQLPAAVARVQEASQQEAQNPTTSSSTSQQQRIVLLQEQLLQSCVLMGVKHPGIQRLALMGGLVSFCKLSGSMLSRESAGASAAAADSNDPVTAAGTAGSSTGGSGSAGAAAAAADPSDPITASGTAGSSTGGSGSAGGAAAADPSDPITASGTAGSSTGGSGSAGDAAAAAAGADSIGAASSSSSNGSDVSSLMASGTVAAAGGASSATTGSSTGDEVEAGDGGSPSVAERTGSGSGSSSGPSANATSAVTAAGGGAATPAAGAVGGSSASSEVGDAPQAAPAAGSNGAGTPGSTAGSISANSAPTAGSTDGSTTSNSLISNESSGATGAGGSLSGAGGNGTGVMGPGEAPGPLGGGEANGAGAARTPSSTGGSFAGEGVSAAGAGRTGADSAAGTTGGGTGAGTDPAAAAGGGASGASGSSSSGGMSAGTDPAAAAGGASGASGSSSSGGMSAGTDPAAAAGGASGASGSSSSGGMGAGTDPAAAAGGASGASGSSSSGGMGAGTFPAAAAGGASGASGSSSSGGMSAGTDPAAAAGGASGASGSSSSGGMSAGTDPAAAAGGASGASGSSSSGGMSAGTDPAAAAGGASGASGSSSSGGMGAGTDPAAAAGGASGASGSSSSGGMGAGTFPAAAAGGASGASGSSSSGGMSAGTDPAAAAGGASGASGSSSSGGMSAGTDPAAAAGGASGASRSSSSGGMGAGTDPAAAAGGASGASGSSSSGGMGAGTDPAAAAGGASGASGSSSSGGMGAGTDPAAAAGGASGSGSGMGGGMSADAAADGAGGTSDGAASRTGNGMSGGSGTADAAGGTGAGTAGSTGDGMGGGSGTAAADAAGGTRSGTAGSTGGGMGGGSGTAAADGAGGTGAGAAGSTGSGMGGGRGTAADAAAGGTGAGAAGSTGGGMGGGSGTAAADGAGGTGAGAAGSTGGGMGGGSGTAGGRGVGGGGGGGGGSGAGLGSGSGVEGAGGQGTVAASRGSSISGGSGGRLGTTAGTHRSIGSAANADTGVPINVTGIEGEVANGLMASRPAGVVVPAVAAAAAATRLSAAPWEDRSGSVGDVGNFSGRSSPSTAGSGTAAAADPLSALATNEESAATTGNMTSPRARSGAKQAAGPDSLVSSLAHSSHNLGSGTASHSASAREARLAAVWSKGDQDEQDGSPAATAPDAEIAGRLSGYSEGGNTSDYYSAKDANVGSSSTAALEGDTSELPSQGSNTASVGPKLSSEEEQLLAEEVLKAMENCSSSLAAGTAGALQALGMDGGARDGGGRTSSQIVGARMEATLLVQSLAEVKKAAKAWLPGNRGGGGSLIVSGRQASFPPKPFFVLSISASNASR